MGTTILVLFFMCKFGNFFNFKLQSFYNFLNIIVKYMILIAGKWFKFY